MAGANLIVFRDLDQVVSGRDLARQLLDLANTRNNTLRSRWDGVLLAGQVECALSDCGREPDAAAALTDMLASPCLGAECRHDVDVCMQASEVASSLPQTLRINQPEGFAFYGLHPGDLADEVAKIEPSGAIAVIGIRSIGTTLSAVATAALKRRGVAASRITVRPIGHPYNREVKLEEHQSAWLRHKNGEGATFFIVDEGPGLSGSSFLSVAECLVHQGIGADRVTLIGTREVDPAQLCAPNAFSRWNRFGWRRVSSRISERFKDSILLSGGTWRDLLLPAETEPPVFWPEMDRVKYWSRDHNAIFKFEGFGEFGCRTRERARAMAEAGFGPKIENAGDGMSQYNLFPGSR